MASSTSQAWLYAMTSALASAIGGAMIYLDPLLHALGMSRQVNLLDSHAVLSAVLSGASGAMAYTSISVLTRESTEYLSRATKFPAISQYPGAAAALLFIIGSCLNLALERVSSLITPNDSPIKHVCASHPPSPSSSHSPPQEASSSRQQGGQAGSSQIIHIDDSSSISNTSSVDGAGLKNTQCSNKMADHHANERLPLLSSCSTDGNAHSCHCEYACTDPKCLTMEHCHITPLYPHVHAHGHEHHEAEAEHRHTHAIGNSKHCGHPHHSADEPAVQLGGPGSRSTSQVSTHHQQLLLRVGLQTAVAIGLHKLPEGLVIFLSRQASPKLGLSVAASLFFHNLPEGMMLALPLFLATQRRHLAFISAALMGALPPAVGAALGMLVLSDVERKDAKLAAIFGTAFGITSGMMCMVAFNGMLPTARIYDKSGNVVAWFFALGVAFMLFANTLFA
ncbi:Zinc transporter [Coemansia brasiliensis]|uniref:Zinc transporter n=1 Tax=Coemansia brasiliensis TaxID=2650707 RepID=A0A9W8I6G6_9FUNG|nr:Zinc transporter [Coemansia brasiliensis]